MSEVESPSGDDKPLTEPPGEEGDDSVNDPGDIEKIEEGDLEDTTPLDDEDDEDESDIDTA